MLGAVAQEVVDVARRNRRWWEPRRHDHAGRTIGRVEVVPNRPRSTAARSSGDRGGCGWRLIDGYGGAMLLYLVLWRATGDRFLPVYALGFVAHLLLPVAFIWLPLTLLRRRRTSLMIQMVCAVAFVWLFGDAFGGRSTDPLPVDVSSVTVMTYNLGGGLAKPDRLVGALRESGADIVGLQEVTPHVASALGAELSSTFPYQALYGLGTPGKALLSRFPIVRSELLRLRPDRPDLRAVVDVDGTDVTVIVAHPLPPRVAWSIIARRPGAEAQVRLLLEVVESTEGPLLLLGDLNMTQMHRLYGQLRSAGMRDVYLEAGDGPGFTGPIRLERFVGAGSALGNLAIPPFLRIDYIWVSSGWLIGDAWVGEGASSDHRPVIAQIALPQSGGVDAILCRTHV